MFTDEQIEQVRPAVAEFFGPMRGEWYADACRMGADSEAPAIVWACRYRELAREAAELLEGFVESVKYAIDLLYASIEAGKMSDALLPHLMGMITHPFDGRAYRTRGEGK